VAVRLDEIVARFGGEIVGAGDTAISRIARWRAPVPANWPFSPIRSIDINWRPPAPPP
jgi:hypothetical protein